MAPTGWFCRSGITDPCRAQCSDHDLDMPEGVRRALMDRAAKTPRNGLQVNLYPNTYYGFAIRGDCRHQDERDRYELLLCRWRVPDRMLSHSPSSRHSACLCHQR